MTVDEFYSRLVDTYCPRDPQKLVDAFPPAVQSDVKAWLKTQPQSRLATIWAELVKGFSRRWRVAPGVAELEDARRAAMDLEPVNPALLPDPDAPLLLDDASPMRDEKVGQGFEAFMDAVKHGRNPATDERVTSVLQELGYEVGR